jgi:hypothetical protein
VVPTSAIVVKLQGQLLAWERELDSWEGALVAFKNGLVTFECALGRACMERYAECTHAEAVR